MEPLRSSWYSFMIRQAKLNAIYTTKLSYRDETNGNVQNSVSYNTLTVFVAAGTLPALCIVEKYPFWVFYYFAQSLVFLGILFSVLTYPFKIPKCLCWYKNLKSIILFSYY